MTLEYQVKFMEDSSNPVEVMSSRINPPLYKGYGHRNRGAGVVTYRFGVTTS
jgi:hypothetical protein